MMDGKPYIHKLRDILRKNITEFIVLINFYFKLNVIRFFKTLFQQLNYE